MSREVNMMRFLAICFMMMVHIPKIYDFTSGRIGLTYETLVTFATEGLALIASPLLGLLSGYFCVTLVRRYGTDGFIKNKAITLVLPLILWNAIIFSMYYSLYILSGRQHWTFISSIDINTIIGIWALPLNLPLHYLADLFKCCLVFAAVNAALNARGVGDESRARFYVLLAVVLCVVLLLAQVAYGVTDKRSGEFRPLIRYDLALFFFLGVSVACHKVQLAEMPAAFDRWVPWFVVALLLGLLLLLSAASVRVDASYGANSVQNAAMGLTRRFVGAFLMIAAVAKLSMRGWIAEVPRHFTFRLFCSHAVVFQFLVAVAMIADVNIVDSAAKMALLLVLFPAIALAFAWVSLQVQHRLADALGPGRVQRFVRALP